VRSTLWTLTPSTSAISIANSSSGTNTSRSPKHWSVSRHYNHLCVTDYHILQVAQESAAKFNPHVKLQAHHANIKDTQFNIEWFQGFNLVFNALDNLDARRHVNKMCLAADVPLIESGTTGFNGQVQVIKKVCNSDLRRLKSDKCLQCQGKTECYDCNTKEVPKSFPVCTIRSTPSQPIHCIVWAKSYLFTYVMLNARRLSLTSSSEIFGIGEDEAPEFDLTEDSENGG